MPCRKNGQKLKSAYKIARGSLQLFPTVGLHSASEVVSINLGATPFNFDLGAYMAGLQAAQRAEIDG